jgi:hypothetical protein
MRQSATFREYLIEYVPGARLADIRYQGHVIDCVQVRAWEWERNPADQRSEVPSVTDLRRVLAEWHLDNVLAPSMADRGVTA